MSFDLGAPFKNGAPFFYLFSGHRSWPLLLKLSQSDYLNVARKDNLKMKFVLKNNTDIPACGFKFHFPSQTGMSIYLKR
jgi:hypothetical protein